MSERTDAEVICEFMEPKPTDGRGDRVDTPESRWWVYSYTVEPQLRDASGKPPSVFDKREFVWTWHPNTLTLDALREVEERLTDEQAGRYESLLALNDLHLSWALVHASADQKIKALAAVLREGK